MLATWHPYTRASFLCQWLQSDTGKHMLSSPPASPLPKYGRNRIRAGRRTKTQPKRVIRANVHGSHHHPHNEKRRHGGSLNRRSSSRSRSSHRDGSRQGKSNDGRRPSSFTRSCPILASASGHVTENSSSPPPASTRQSTASRSTSNLLRGAVAAAALFFSDSHTTFGADASPATKLAALRSRKSVA